MTKHYFSRRQLLAALGAAAASSLTTGGPAPAADHNQLRLGIATLGFPKLSNRQLAEELAKAGFSTIQLFLAQTDSRYWRYNGYTDVSGLTAQRAAAIAAAYRSAKIAIHSLGVYTNLIHAEPAERKAALAYFEAMMKVGRDMGVSVFITEAGHYQGPGPEPRVPHNFQEDVWKQMVATGKELAELAERHQATVLFEPFYRHFLASAKRARLFLQAVDSKRIRALLDPANLLEVNDLEEMFAQLGPWIDCLHAKDRKYHVDRGVPAGEGDLDYPKFVTLAAKHTPHAPLVLEYVGPENYRQALAHLRGTMKKAGIGERS